jgi:Tol biopolymer transport system component
VYSTSAYRNGRTLVFVSFAIAGLPHRFEIHEFNREGKWVAVHAHLDARDFPGLGSVSALSPDGETLALISGNSKIFFFSLSSGTWERLTLERPADLSSQQCIAFTPDGKGILVAERDGELAWYE